MGGGTAGVVSEEGVDEDAGSAASSSSERDSSSHESAMGSVFFLGLGLVWVDEAEVEVEVVIGLGVSMAREERAEVISSFEVVGCFEAIVMDLRM